MHAFGNANAMKTLFLFLLILVCINFLSENWFSIDEKDPIAYALVEVIEGADMKPSDLNGWFKRLIKLLDTLVVPKVF